MSGKLKSPAAIVGCCGGVDQFMSGKLKSPAAIVGCCGGVDQFMSGELKSPTAIVGCCGRECEVEKRFLSPILMKVDGMQGIQGG